MLHNKPLSNHKHMVNDHLDKFIKLDECYLSERHIKYFSFKELPDNIQVTNRQQ